MHRHWTLDPPVERGPNNSAQDHVRIVRVEYTPTQAQVTFAVGTGTAPFLSFRQGQATIKDSDFTTINTDFTVKGREDKIFNYLKVKGMIGNGTASDQP